MSEVNKNSLEKILPQLKCHFTWNLLKEDHVSRDLKDRVCNQIEFLNTKFKATMYNLLAYIKHLGGQNEEALECLQQAEDLIQQEHTDQAEIRSLVTWGNYAWVYYHMGRLSEAQAYVDKVKRVCEKFSNPYSIECPELDCEEGWTLLTCGAKRNERAKVCFEKALEEKPNNPEFSSGLAIAVSSLDDKPQKQFPDRVLKQAIELNPDNHYIKVLLALILQKLNKEEEGEPLVVEALEKASCQADVLRSAAKFYQRKHDLDKAIELFQKSLESLPNNEYVYHQIACCYRAKEKQIQNTNHSEVSRNTEKTEHQGKSGDTPILSHLKNLTISTKSTEMEKVKDQLQNGAENKLPQNAPNFWYLQGLTHKLNGDLLQAAECFEKELGCLLRNSPSGISKFFLQASKLEEDSEEGGQEVDSSTLSELPEP